MKSFEQEYPYIAAWVEDGCIEIGRDDYSSSFVRVVDHGGMIWESEPSYPSLEHALTATEKAIAEWCSIHIPDIVVGAIESPPFTSKQGQYLAFIYNYTQTHGRAPAEADLQRFFRVSPPTVHQMILKLEEIGLLSRVPGQARSLKVLISSQSLPVLIRRD